MPSGARSAWWRDAVGRPTQHAVATGDTVHRLRKYVWGADDRLLSIEEQGGGVQAREHDGRGMFVRSRIGDVAVEGSWPHDLGRVFDTPARNDRAYGAGGELQWRRDAEGTTQYEHDDSGRLSGRTDPDGGSWCYHWSDAGRLVQVDRPDGSGVEFGYDALSRRLSKCAGGVQTCFVWDGDVVLHEWGEAREAAEPRPVAGEEAYERALLRVRKELRGLLPEAQAKPRWAAQLKQAVRGFPALVARLRLADGLA